MTVLEHIREHLLESVGMARPSEAMPSLEVLRETEWSSEFEQLMRNRMLMGAFRYERLSEKKRGEYDCVGSIKRRLAEYERTGNLENLVDVANVAMIEFLYSDHPNRHFHGTDDGNVHTEKKR